MSTGKHAELVTIHPCSMAGRLHVHNACCCRRLVLLNMPEETVAGELSRPLECVSMCRTADCIFEIVCRRSLVLPKLMRGTKRATTAVGLHILVSISAHTAHRRHVHTVCGAGAWCCRSQMRGMLRAALTAKHQHCCSGSTHGHCRSPSARCACRRLQDCWCCV
jgi:hypothetical protein